MQTTIEKLKFVFPLFMLLAMITQTAKAQEGRELPDDLDQLIQMKTGLLEQYSSLQKTGPEDKAIQTLRSIVNIHRKAFQVATANNEAEDLIVKLRIVYGNDGEYLSDELFRRSEFTESAKLRAELVTLFNEVLGEDHPSAKSMYWKSVAAKKLSTAPRTRQVAYSVATGAAQQGKQAMGSGQYDVAAQIFSQLVDAQVAVMGENHPDVANSLNEFGQALWLQKSYTEAEAMYQQGLKARETTMGKDLQYAAISFNLGRLFQDTERYGDAEKAYLETAAVEEPILGKTDKSFLQTLQQLTYLYELTGEKEKQAGIEKRIASADPLATIVAHLPRNTIGAAAIRPSLLQSDSGLQMMPFEVIEAAGQQQLGLNPLDVEAFVAFVTLPVGEEANFGFLFKMKDGVQAESAWQRPGQGELIEFGEGKSYRKLDSEASDSQCVVEYSDGSVLIGTEESVKQSLSQPGGGSVGGMLLESRNGSQVTAAADVRLVRGFAMVALQEVPPIPPALEGLKGLVADVDTIQTWVNLSQGLTVSLALNTIDEEAADRTSAAITDALAFGQQMTNQEMEQNIPGNDAVQLATRAYAARIAASYFQMIQPTVAGSTVTVEANVANPSIVGGPVLVALLLPAVQQAREAARRTQDKNSLKMIGLAMHNYHDVHNTFPARASYDKSGKALLSWRVHLLPFLDQNELYEEFHLDEPWDSEHNLTLVARMPEVYRSNSFSDPEKTVFLTADGSGTMMEGSKSVRLPDVTDGTSNTIFVMEVNPENAVTWTQPEDLPFDAENPTAGVGQIRSQGFQALFADGSVRLIPIEITEENLKNLIIRNDGNLIEDF